MLQFTGRRLGFISLVSVAIIFFVNLGMDMSRNSRVKNPSYDLVEYSQKAWSSTRSYVDGALSGNLGTVNHNTLGRIPVWDLLLDSYLKSMGLLLISLFFAALLGILLGIFAALLKNQQILFAVLLFTILGVSMPSFFAGLLLQHGEILYFKTFGTQLVKTAGFGWDFQHLLMPVLVLMARPLAYLTRSSFLSLNSVLDENYIRTARSKGLPNSWIVYTHALRNVAVPVLTAVGVSLRFSLSTLPVVEFFFSWPGLGLRLVEAINAHQTNVVVTFALALGLTFLSINLLLDITYQRIDPRLREISV